MCQLPKSNKLLGAKKSTDNANSEVGIRNKLTINRQNALVHERP